MADPPHRTSAALPALGIFEEMTWKW
jgi:hypothetical protein